MPQLHRPLAPLVTCLAMACAPPPVASEEGPTPTPAPRADAGSLGRTAATGGPCAPCSDASDCGGPRDLCLIAPGGEQVCTLDCTRAACPTGYDCTALREGVSQCVPSSGRCARASGGTDGGRAVGEDGGGDIAPAPNDESGASGACGMSEPEAAVFALANRERGLQGLRPYDCHAGLGAVARAHSQAMCDLGFFSHFDPSGRAPWDRVRDAGLSPRGTAENIAGGQRTPEAAHSSWMSSSGHRRNILQPDYEHIGVGYVTCATGWGHYWTQVFTSGLQ